MLLRHAKAVPQGLLADENRPLAERGRTDTPKIAEFAASRSLLPDLALFSPALRTRETWELFSASLSAPPPHRIEPRLYSAPVERILDIVRETARDVGTLLLVGHNPGCEEAARLLTGSGDTDALIRFGGTMPTASLAVVDVPGDWKSIEPRTGRLEFFVTPKSLGAGED